MRGLLLVDNQFSVPGNKPASANQILVTPAAGRLTEIDQPATSLVIWERQLPAALCDWLSQLDVEDLPHGRILSKRDDLERSVTCFFEKCDARHFDAAQLLAQDIVSLSHLYADIVKSDQVDIRLEAIQHDACWKFHLDQVALRMVTTYVGEGTQYVVPKFSEQALCEQVSYTGPIETIAEQAVALFKGAHSRPGSGVVHRSPPASSFSKARLLLCINIPSLASPELWQSTE